MRIGRRWVMLAVVIALVGAAIGCGYFWRDDGVKVYHGVVETQEVRLGSKVGGRVGRVNVREGDSVEKGRVLVEFDIPELTSRIAQAQRRVEILNAAALKSDRGPRKQEIDAAEAEFHAAEARLARVRKGWREEEIRSIIAEVDSTAAGETYAQSDFDRMAVLFRSRGVSQERLDQSKANLARAQGAAAAAKAKLDMVKTGSRVEEIAEAEALVRQAKASFELMKAGTREEDIAAAKAAVKEAEARLAELNVDALEAKVVAFEPVVVEIVSVRPGDLVPPGQAVVRVLRADDRWVKIFVPETELTTFRVGLPVTASTDVGDSAPGNVIYVSSTSEFTPRNVQTLEGRKSQYFAVKIHVDDPKFRFKAGMAAHVSIKAR